MLTEERRTNRLARLTWLRSADARQKQHKSVPCRPTYEQYTQLKHWLTLRI